MNLAILCHDESTNTWSAEYDGQVLVKSTGGESSKNYVISRIEKGLCAKAIKLNVTGFSNVGNDFAPNPLSESVGKAYVPPPAYVDDRTVEQRFAELDESVDIILRDVGVRSLIITGAGSVGKTFHTKSRLKVAGLKSTEEAYAIAHTLSPEEQVVADRILERMQECKQQAIEYYKKHGLPKKVKDENEDPDDDEDDEDEAEELDLNFGKVDFTSLHTSRDIKDRACGGRYHTRTHMYEFNIKLAAQNPDEYYEVVVPHEIAHHIQFLLFPKTMRKLGGHGKAWQNIMKKVFNLAADRYHYMDTSDVRLAPDLAGDYHYAKGYTSAKGLYRTLFENKKKLVVLDDCDAAWKNDVSANLLKAALDSDEDRYVSWNVEGSDSGDLPRKFLFEGRVIFISNVASIDFPQPLKSRSLRCDVSLTMEEAFERMRQILPLPEFAPGVDMKVKQEAYDFLWENRELATEITSRALLNTILVANSGSKMWKQIALRNIM